MSIYSEDVSMPYFPMDRLIRAKYADDTAITYQAWIERVQIHANNLVK